MKPMFTAGGMVNCSNMLVLMMLNRRELQKFENSNFRDC